MDGELSELGKEQARLVGGRLASYVFDIGIVSDLKRARDTAAAIVEQNTTLENMVEWSSVRERNFGVFEGRPHSELREVQDSMTEREKSSWRPPGGETGDEFRTKVEQFLKDLSQEVENLEREKPTVLLVTHSGFIRQLNLVFVSSHGCLMPEGNDEFSTYLGSRQGWSPNTGVSTYTLHRAGDGRVGVQCQVSGCVQHLR